MASIWQFVSENSATIQTVCIVLSAVAAFLVIWHNGRISRRQATINMVMTTFFDGDHKESYQSFKKLMLEIKESKSDVRDYAIERHDNEEGRNIILQTANHYEMVSLAIKTKVFDEKYYKYWFYTQFLKDFDKLFPFIESVRDYEHNQAYYCEFQTMVDRWKRKKHPVKHPAKMKKIWWILSNQVSRAKAALDADDATS